MYNTMNRTGVQALINLSYDLIEHPEKYQRFDIDQITKAIARSLSRPKKVQILTNNVESIEPFVDILLLKFKELKIQKTAQSTNEVIQLLKHIGIVKGI